MIKTELGYYAEKINGKICFRYYHGIFEAKSADLEAAAKEFDKFMGN